MLEGNRNEWRRSEKAGYNLLSIKRLDYAEFKRNLRKRAIRGVPGDVNSRECETCGRALLSTADMSTTSSHMQVLKLMSFTFICLP